MFIQSYVDPVFVSLIMKIKGRLTDLADRKYIDSSSDKTITELNKTYNDALDKAVKMGKVKRIKVKNYLNIYN